MKLRSTLLAVGLVLTMTWAASADEPDWPALSYTMHNVFQAVDASGNGTYSIFSGDPAKMRGVILNDSRDMLDPTPGANPFLGGSWQIYIQTIETGDFGGTACWMGQNIGRIVGDPNGNYTDTEWLDELDRLNHDPDSGHQFAPGDLVEIRARAPGLHVRGKTNINEQHAIATEADFDIVLLQADYGLPTPQVVTLSDVKDATDDFIFDQTRATGAEYYQGTLVRINGVSFVDAAGWGPDASLTIQDGTGRTFPVLLGRGGGFSAYPAPAGTFDLIGIFDQEDLDGSDGLTDGYRIWVMDYDGNGSLIDGEGCDGDVSGDGSVGLADLQILLAYYGSTSGVDYTSGDMDRDGDVDLSDLQALLANYGTVCW